MNAGIVTSFVIGGILILAILAMNLNVSRSSSGLTMRQITQENVETVSDFLNYDFPKIGYEIESVIPDAITTAENNRIIFKSNIDNSGAQETVEWFFDTSSPVTNGDNPDDYILKRIVDGTVTDLAVGVTKFKLTYLDSDRNVITAPISSQSDRNSIRHIKINLIVSSKEKLGDIGPGDGEYLHSPWERTFTPKNLQN